MTGRLIGAEYNTHTTLPSIPVMLIVHVKPLAINYAMFMKPFATNAVKTAQIYSWWYEEITWIDSAQRNSDTPHAYISVVDETSRQLCSLLSLRIRLWPRLLAPVQ